MKQVTRHCDRCGQNILEGGAIVDVQAGVSLGRVDLGGCPPKSPTDPGLHITRTRFLIS